MRVEAASAFLKAMMIGLMASHSCNVPSTWRKQSVRASSMAFNKGVAHLLQPLSATSFQDHPGDVCLSVQPVPARKDDIIEYFQ